MKTCPGCTVDVEIGEWGYRVRCYQEPAEEGHPAYCLVNEILDEHNEPVSEQAFEELKVDALGVAGQKCSQMREGRRDAANEAKKGGE